MSRTKALTIQEALLRSKEFVWIDVRSELEYERAHIPHAINVPILCNEEVIFDTYADSTILRREEFIIFLNVETGLDSKDHSFF